jgi:FAD/FMN-containing dehydrogenase
VTWDVADLSDLAANMGGMTSALPHPLSGTAYVPGDPGYEAEVAAFNTAVSHTPDIVVGAADADDVVRSVRFAGEHGLRVGVHATGHGAHAPFAAGLLVSTRRLDHVSLDPASRVATIGAGVRWADVVAAAAGHGLAPVTGSSVTVGAVGYLLGGGLGPLVRSHGFSSDHVEGLTVVTGAGELVEASADEHPDLFWALRGGKYGLGVVTEVRLRLAELGTLYAGSLFFAEEHIEAALRTWVDWTATADAQVSTSVAIIRFPPLDAVPEPLRGRRLLSLRFAYPGPAADGERLAAPLRAAAPVHLDDLGELPLADVARIHNDPPVPGPGWVTGVMLSHADQTLATTVLERLGAGTDAPFVAAEVRHLGAAASRDVPGGSAVGGRDGAFTFSLVALPQPALFETVAPAAAAAVVRDLKPWTAPETTINFTGMPRPGEPPASPWSPATAARLAEVRRRYDPQGLLA